MVHFADMVNLEALRLGAAKINDASLTHLKALPKLKYLELGSIEGVTDAGVQKLQAARETAGLVRVKELRH